MASEAAAAMAGVASILKLSSAACGASNCLLLRSSGILAGPAAGLASAAAIIVADKLGNNATVAFTLTNMDNELMESLRN